MLTLRSRTRKLSINVGTKRKQEAKTYSSKRNERLRDNFIKTGRKSDLCFREIRSN